MDFILCEKCGAKNLPEYTFCGNCSARLDGKFNCSDCQTLLEKDMLFCTNCGKMFDGKWVCPSCNTLLDDNFEFCFQCGQRKSVENSIIHKKYKESKIHRADKNTFIAKNKSKIIKIVKCSVIAMLALVMFVLSFMPIFSDKHFIEDFVAGEDLNLQNTPNINLSGIDYISFLVDITLRYDSEDDLLDAPLTKRTMDLIDEMGDLVEMNTISSKNKAIKLFPKVFIGSVRLTLRHNNIDGNTFPGTTIYFIVMGVLSMLYILSTATFFVLALVKLIILLLKDKEIKIKGFNLLLALPLVVIIPIILVGKTFPLSSLQLVSGIFITNLELGLSGCLITVLCIISTMLVINIVFHLTESGVKDKKKLFIRIASFVLICITIGVAGTSLFRIKTDVKPIDRSNERTYTASFDNNDMLSAFTDDKTLDAFQDIFSSEVEYIDNYLSSLNNLNHNEINDTALKRLHPTMLVIVNRYSSINYIFQAIFLLNFSIYILLCIALVAAYLAFFKDEASKRVQKTMLLITFFMNLAVAILTIIGIVILNLTIDNSSITFVIGESVILLGVFMLLSIAFSSKKRKGLEEPKA